MDSVLRDLPNVFCYLDDLLIYSKSEQDHLRTLEELFDRLDKAGLTISLKKCVFGVEELDFLGYHVNKNGIVPIKKKVDSIVNYPAPVKQKELPCTQRSRWGAHQIKTCSQGTTWRQRRHQQLSIN